MEQYRILIWNAEDPAVKAVIEPFGYNSAKIEEGKALFNEVEALAETQRKEYAGQYTVSTGFIEKQEEARSNLNTLRKFAKFIFKTNNEAYNTLNLRSRLPLGFADWLQAARYFYERLQEHPEWVTALVPFGIQKNVAGKSLELLSELKSLQEQRQRETGDAQRATQARNEKHEELQAWYGNLRDLVKILFEDADAQYLEKLGILVRS
jgi:hypothetical protein